MLGDQYGLWLMADGTEVERRERFIFGCFCSELFGCFVPAVGGRVRPRSSVEGQ